MTSLILPSGGVSVNQFSDSAPMFVENLATFDTISVCKVLPPNARLNLGFSGENKLRICRRRLPTRWQSIVVSFELDDLLKTEGIYASHTQSDINTALEIATERTKKLLGVDFDASSANVTRLDVNRFFYTPGGAMQKYFAAFKRHAVKQTTKASYQESKKYTGVKFYNRSRSLKIYDKHARLAYLLSQNKIKMSRGKLLTFQNILQAELSLRTKEAIGRDCKKFFGTEKRTASKILTVEFAEYLMSKTLSELQMKADALSVEQQAAAIRERVPNQITAARLIDFVLDIERRGIEKVRKNSDFQHRRRQLANVGLWRSYFADDEGGLESLDSLPPDDRLIEW